MERGGNVEKSLFGFSTLNLLKRKKHEFILLANYRYGESFDSEDTRDGNLHLRYSFRATKNTEVEIFQQTEFNKFQDLNLRALLGSGIRLNLFSKKKLRAHLGIGAFYEKEEIEDSIDIENPRLNNYISLNYQSDNFEFSTTLYYQPNTESFKDYRVRGNFGIESKMTKSFTQTIQYSLMKDTLPPSGIVQTDRILTAGLNFKY